MNNELPVPPIIPNIHFNIDPHNIQIPNLNINPNPELIQNYQDILSNLLNSNTNINLENFPYINFNNNNEGNQANENQQNINQNIPVNNPFMLV